jgi:hypothetical protein
MQYEKRECALCKCAFEANQGETLGNFRKRVYCSFPCRSSAMKPMSDTDRFMSLCEPDTNGGCWLWCGTGHPSGYGIFRTYLPGVGRITHAAHRFSFSIMKGPIGDLHVLHRCDVPQCVNPDHLFLGTQKDNMADKARKNRSARGYKRIYLNEAVEMDRLRSSGASISCIARKAGRSKGSVSAAIEKFRAGNYS